METVAEHWRRDEADTRAGLASLTDVDLDAPPVRRYEDRQPLWHYVMHLYSHGLQQFSEAAVLLTRGRAKSPGDIGILEFVQATGCRL